MSCRYLSAECRLTAIILLFAVSAAGAEDSILRFGTGSDGGFYHKLGMEIADIVNEANLTAATLEVVNTEGSVDNLARLQDAELDIAIVQNDIAYYVYEGIRGHESFTEFTAGIPLFAEYVQLLVREGSDIRTLGDLSGKTIAMGETGSGSYHNAVDLMTEAGLRPGTDIEVVYANPEEALPRLRSGELDSIITTGALFPSSKSSDQSDIRALALSNEIVTSLSIRSPYYVPETVKTGADSNEQSVSTVAVMAYLVFSSRVSTSQAHEIARLVDEAAPRLRAIAGDEVYLIPVEQANVRRPVPLHPGVRSYMQEKGYLEGNATLYWAIFLGGALIVLVVYAQIRVSAYDRLGNIRSATGAWPYKLMLAFSRLNTLIVVSVLFILLLLVLVEAIQHFETEYAREHNIRNRFADIGFWQAVLWMFMFMGAGHTEDIFPLSTVGRILATTLPFLGIGGILSFSLIGLDESRARIAARKRGRLPSKAKNHVLVCGWNDKAVRIIYSLTSDDVPRRKPVVVVAEIDGDMPLENHNFDPRYVSYQRGDSADHSVLSRANIQHADAAVVVAGLKKRAGRNVRSILSVMALKEAYADQKSKSQTAADSLFVAAELLHDENRRLFHACGADAVVSAEIVADRMAAQCCVNRNIVDFTLDALTYDNASELYSTRVSRIGRPRHGILSWKQKALSILGVGQDPHPLLGKSLGDVRKSLAGHGINVVALAKGREHQDVLVGDVFDNGHYVFPKDIDGRDTILSEEHVLLFMADRHRDVHRAALKTKVLNGKSAEAVKRVDQKKVQLPRQRRILLVGEWGRCRSVFEILEAVPWCTASILTERMPKDAYSRLQCTVGDLADFDSWQRAGIKDVDQVTILAQPGEKANAGEGFGEYGEIDAWAIFAARFARSSFSSVIGAAERAKPVIAAEMLGQRSRQLFKDAGIDVIIPSSLLVERMLTKLVYSKGSVCRFLMALLAFDDSRHVMTLSLDDVDYGYLLDRTFEQLMELLPPEVQLLGVLPSDQILRESLENSVEDFQYHFITEPKSSASLGYRSAPGDDLLVIVDRRNELGEENR